MDNYDERKTKIDEQKAKECLVKYMADKYGPVKEASNNG